MNRSAWIAAIALASTLACATQRRVEDDDDPPGNDTSDPKTGPPKPGVGALPPPGGVKDVGKPEREGEGERETGGPVTGAVTLLEYVDWDDAPRFCRSPKAMLSHLDELLDSDTCDAQRVGDGDRAKIWLECRSKPDAAVAEANCDVAYDGRLWIVRAPDSESNYTLLAQGTVTRICRTSDGRERPTPASASDTAEQRRTAHELEEKLRPCQKP